jgi:hypothetical protein
MKTILTNLVCLAAVLLIASCSREGIKERPDGVVATGERLETFQKIMGEFPEHKNAESTHAELFEAKASKQVVLTKESAVYLTFISEGASLQNSLGWYTYNVNSKPGDATQIEKNILFPHVSERVLKQGDRLQLGKGTFPAGTVIGFFLIIDGWDAGEIHYDRETFYTNFEFNTDDKQQHVLFQQQTLGDIVLAFEDVVTTHESDQDFNDIIFTVSDNTKEEAVASFDLTNVVKL